MTITKDRRELYPAMSAEEVDAIDAAYSAANRVLQDHGITTKGDDRAENLVGAIARFVEDSKR